MIKFIYFFYGLSFFTLGVSLLAIKAPRSAAFLRPVIMYAGVFSLLHGVSEWLLMLQGIVDGFGSIPVNASRVLGGLSFFFLLASGFRLAHSDTRALSSLQRAILAGLAVVWLGALLIEIPAFDRFQLADALARWLVGAPAGVWLGVHLYKQLALQDRQDTAHQKYYQLASRLPYVTTFGAIFAYLAMGYGVSCLFGPTLPVAPFHLINAEAFSAFTGFEIAIVRTVFAFSCAVFVLVAVRALQTIEWYNMSVIIEEQTASLRHKNLDLAKAVSAAKAATRAKSDFLASMSHELRTPLNAIIGYSQFLQMDQQDLDLGKREKLGIIEKSGKALLSLVDDLLDLSAIERSEVSYDIQNVSAHEIAMDAVNELRPKADEKQVSLDVSVLEGEKGSLVKADSLRLRQVLINLIDNAIKYNVQEGRVCIGAASCDPGMVELWVEDTGVGIKQDDSQRIFDLFNRGAIDVHHAQKGMGIGLAVSKRHMEGMSGAIGVESGGGRGSRFWIRLPVAAEAA